MSFMHRLLAVGLGILAMSLVSCDKNGPATSAPVKPSPTETVSRPSPVTFSLPPPSGADCPTPAFGPSVVNGVMANTADYPAVLFDFNRFRPPCAGTLIGERVFLTAAHCVDESRTTIELRVAEDRVVKGECDRAPAYTGGRTDVDVALCLLDAAVSGIAFETINVDASVPGIDDELELTGFGCCNEMSGGGGVFRKARTTVETAPSPGDSYIRTRGAAVLCEGDSGGPAYQPGSHGVRGILVGVNSRTNLTTYRSSLTSTSASEVLQFITDWSSEHRTSICGVHPDAQNCRLASAR